MKSFIYKKVSDKLNYGIFHPDIENEEKLLGWIGKESVEHENNKKFTNANQEK